MEEVLNLNSQPIPEFLSHPYAGVVATTNHELNTILKWAAEQGKLVGRSWGQLRDRLPLVVYLHGEVVGWNDRMDRIGTKFSFEEFMATITK